MEEVKSSDGRRDGDAEEGQSADLPAESGGMSEILQHAFALGESKKWEEAVMAYHQAAELFPDRWEVLFNLGLALKELKRWHDAEPVFRRVTELIPDDANAHFELGYALGQNGSTDAAERSYRQAIALDPSRWETYYNLGLACGERGRWSDAEAVYRELTRLQPENPEGYFGLAFALGELGDWTAAETEYRRVIERDPDRREAHFNLAVACAAQGLIAEAEAGFRHVLDGWPETPMVALRLAGCLAEQRKWDEAEGFYRQAAAVDPLSSEAHVNLGLVRQRLGDRSGAEAAFAAAAGLRPKVVEGHINVGYALVELGRLTDAERSFRTALDLDPGHALARNNLACVLRESGFPEAAYPHAQKTLERQANSWMGRLTLAEVEIDLGEETQTPTRYVAAVTALTEGLELLLKQGNALAKRDYVPIFRALRGYAWARLGNREEAAADFRHCIELRAAGPTGRGDPFTAARVNLRAVLESSAPPRRVPLRPAQAMAATSAAFGFLALAYLWHGRHLDTPFVLMMVTAFCGLFCAMLLPYLVERRPATAISYRRSVGKPPSFPRPFITADHPAQLSGE